MAGVLDAVKAMQVAENQQRAREARKQRESAYNQALSANKALGVASLAAPPGIGSAAIAGMNLLNDRKISQMEEEDPTLVGGRSRNRYSTVGQVLFGYGYQDTPQNPAPSVWQRLGNALGGDGPAPPQITDLRGVTWQRDGGNNDSGQRNSQNFNQDRSIGRESMVDDTDRSGYA